MDLGFHRHSLDDSSSEWAELFRVPIVGAISPYDYVLAGMVTAGLGIEAICLYLGTAKTALVERLETLGLATPHDRPLRRPGGKNPWTAEETIDFIGWWVEGVQVACIAEALGRSRSSLYGKRARLGLPPRNRKRLVSRTAGELVAAERRRGEAVGRPPSSPFPSPPSQPASEPAGTPSPEALTECVGTVDPGSGVEIQSIGIVERAAWGFRGGLTNEISSGGEEAGSGAVVSAGELSGSLGDTVLSHGSSCPGPQPDGPRIVGRGRPRRADAITTSGTDKGHSVAPGEVVREDPGMLAAAFDEMRRGWIDRLRQWDRKGDDWAWKNDEELFEFVLRGVGNQLPGSIARDMSFSYSQVAVRLSRLEIVRGRRRLVDRFDLGVACQRMREERHVLRGCGMRRTPFVSLRKHNILFCREARESEKYRSRWSEVNCAAAYI